MGQGLPCREPGSKVTFTKLYRLLLLNYLIANLAGLVGKAMDCCPRGPGSIPGARKERIFTFQNCSTNQIAQMYSGVRDVFA